MNTNLLTPAALSLLIAAPMRAMAQLAYETTRQDYNTKIYIYAKENIGPGVWRFQTKAVGYNPFKKEEIKPHYSNWQTAVCHESTIDGDIVPAIARSGVEAGAPEILKAVCGY